MCVVCVSGIFGRAGAGRSHVSVLFADVGIVRRYTAVAIVEDCTARRGGCQQFVGAADFGVSDDVAVTEQFRNGRAGALNRLPEATSMTAEGTGVLPVRAMRDEAVDTA